jgi:hypothetical protein
MDYQMVVLCTTFQTPRSFQFVFILLSGPSNLPLNLLYPTAIKRRATKEEDF